MALGSPRAALNLGNLFAEGLGVQQNIRTAIALYKEAADAGLVEARNLLFSKFDIVYSASAKEATEPSNSIPASKIISTRELSPVEIYQRNSKSVFLLQAETQGKEGVSGGSAVAISNHIILTNCHVTEGHNLFGIKLTDEWEIVNFAKGNKAADICAYKSNMVLSPINEVRNYETLQVGEKVYAIGSPEGFENTLSEGIISALRLDGKVRKIQFTAPATHGSSGGALFDAQGRLIGITTEFYGDRADLNFAVSIDEAP